MGDCSCQCSEGVWATIVANGVQPGGERVNSNMVHSPLPPPPASAWAPLLESEFKLPDELKVDYV